MSAFISIKLEGVRELERALKRLPEKVYDRVMGKAVRGGGRIIVSGARRRVKRRSGATAKSLGVVVRQYPERLTVAAVVGPRRGFATEVDGKPHDPANTGHLIEFGHGGPHPAPAYPFLRPALDEDGEAAQARMAAEIAKGIEREARRL